MTHQPISFQCYISIALENIRNLTFSDVLRGIETYRWDQIRGGPRAVATSKTERFVIIVNGFQPLTIITKRSILNVAAALDPPLQFPGIFYMSKKLIQLSNLEFLIGGERQLLILSSIFSY